MGWLKLIANMFGPEGIRESMRVAYKDSLSHYLKEFPFEEAHHFALNMIVMNRYRHRTVGPAKPYSEPYVFAELAPFRMLDAKLAIEVVAEYMVIQEYPDYAGRPDARIQWFREQLNIALRKAVESADQTRASIAAMAMASQVDWVAFLDDDVQAKLSCLA